MPYRHSILVVDDEEKIRESLRGLLEDNGYKVKSAGSGAECLQLMSSKRFDLVILDIIMPDMNGIEALRKIKELYKDAEVIIISAYADKEKAITTFRLGAYDIIEKPFEAKELMNTVANCIGQMELRKEVEKKNLKLRESEARYRNLFTNAADAIYMIDPKTREIIDCNPKASEITGYTCKELKAITIEELHPKEDRSAIKRIFRKITETGSLSRVSQINQLRKDGKPVPVEINAATIRLGGEKYILCVCRDITIRRELEQKLREAAMTDDLTKLYNRRGFFTLAEQQYKIAKRTRKGMSLLYVDIDNMKTINDDFGHRAGDQSLLDTSNILKKTFRETDIIARIGGDEFAVLFTEYSEPDIEKIIADKLRNNLQLHNKQSGRGYKLSLSIGMARYEPGHPCSIDKLLAKADSMMYERKKHNHNAMEAI